jgi:ABC-type polar amino acid transport system ATPase subunit
MTGEPILAFESVSKHYGAIVALDRVSFAIGRGEVVCLIGPSGSGKSTLLRCLNRLEQPSAGSVTVDGLDMLAPGTDINHARQRIGMVFQSFNLYPHMTALGNVTLALRKVAGKPRAEADQLGRAALARVGLADRAGHTPGQLSGGQQQRVAIARALVNDPEIVLADEPTGNLDSRTSIEIMGVFQELNAQGMTVVMVTHELDIAHYSSRMVIMRDGRVVTDERVTDRLFAPKELSKLDREQQAVQLA